MSDQDRNFMGRVVSAIQRRWGLTDAEMVGIIGIAPEEVGSDPDGERITAELFRVSEGLFSLFRSAEAEGQVIRQPIERLDGKSPLEVMTTEGRHGISRAMAWSEWVCGRD